MEDLWDIHILRVFWWANAAWREMAYTTQDFMHNFCSIRVVSAMVSKRCVEWGPLPEGFLKWNVDGSARGAPRVGGAGGVLRNHEGEIGGIFSKALGTLWAFEAEVKVIRLALEFSKQFGLRNIIIESDSALVVGWVSSNSHRPWKLLKYLNMIDFLCKKVGCMGVFPYFSGG